MDFLLSEEETEGKVQNRKLFHYALGLAGQNVSYGYVSGWLNYFCINLLHIDPKKVGRVFFASYFWDALNDPSSAPRSTSIALEAEKSCGRFFYGFPRSSARCRP